MEYKSISKYLEKNKKQKKNKGYKFITTILLIIVLGLSCLIFLKYDKNHNQIVNKYLEKNNITMATVNNWYKKNFGDILPFQSIVKDKTKLVFNETLVYNDASIYKDGVKLNVEDNYLIPIIESGIVVFIGNKDNYGKTVIIEQVDGVNTWYGNVDNINVSLYDYVNKGELLAEAQNSFYMVFQKKGKYLKYQDYLK